VAGSSLPAGCSSGVVPAPLNFGMKLIRAFLRLAEGHCAAAAVALCWLLFANESAAAAGQTNGTPFQLGRVICDEAVEAELIRAGTKFLQNGRGTAASNIVNQSDRVGIALSLPAPARRKLMPEQVATRARAGPLDHDADEATHQCVLTTVSNGHFELAGSFTFAPVAVCTDAESWVLFPSFHSSEVSSVLSARGPPACA
jgi:hypothetical protein